ncbi:MAG: cytochrome P450 [Dehalococcoidia bacterium]|nr:cytochrome P450 [Dehalococcoidia bacterium]
MALEIPRDRSPDSSLWLLRDGYQFIEKRARRYGTDIFDTRLLLQRTVCMTGAEAARAFYEHEALQRTGAGPARVQRTLFGQGGVQGLDGAEHRQRKQMFMSLMTPEAIQRLADFSAEQWQARAASWAAAERVVLLDEAEELLCRAVCAWSGIPLPEHEVATRTRDLVLMFESAASVGVKHWQGRLARRRGEAWVADLVRRTRTGELSQGPGQALATIAGHREPDGRLLDERVAAVELLSVLRPTVAVSRFIVFVALALQSSAGSRAKLEAGDLDPEWFVHEVRRFYPFFPFVVARAGEDFEWGGYRIPSGERVLLDLYGTNHDARWWPQPGRFQPERFRDWTGDPFTLIPQGGGDHYAGHRCAGEWVTIALMKTALAFLTTSIRYDVPAQDLRVSLSRIPAAPSSGFVMSNVHRA